VHSELVSDLNINWTSPQGVYSVTGWMRNAFNNQYKTAVNVIAVNALNVGNGTAYSNIAANPYDPRTYGVAVNVRW
jgi:outer membrane receptor protein involved in Fe transport